MSRLEEFAHGAMLAIVAWLIAMPLFRIAQIIYCLLK